MDLIEAELALDREDLVALAYLLGSDYAHGIHGIGPVLAMEIIAEFKGGHVPPTYLLIPLHSSLPPSLLISGSTALDTLSSFRSWLQSPPSLSTSFRRKHAALLAQVKLAPSFPQSEIRQAYLTPEIDDSEEPFTWAPIQVELVRHAYIDLLQVSPHSFSPCLTFLSAL